PALASSDLKGAVALVQGKDGSSPLMNNPMYANQILGEVACRVAEANPVEAEELLTKIGAAVIQNGLDRYLLRACALMAPRDLDRARKLAGSLVQSPQPNNNVAIQRRRGPGAQLPAPNNNGPDQTNTQPVPLRAVYAQLVIGRALANSKPVEARTEVETAIAELRRRVFDEPSQQGDPDLA